MDIIETRRKLDGGGGGVTDVETPKRADKLREESRTRNFSVRYGKPLNLSCANWGARVRMAVQETQKGLT